MNKKLTAFLIVCLLLHGISFAQDDTRKPNFVLILADDLGYGDLGITGSKQIHTPNIDKLAEGGVLFSNAYVSGPVCSPSRAGILTGRNQVTFGHMDNLNRVQPGYDVEYNGLPLTETTIATRLGKLGYSTGIIGKWHLGEAHKFHPLQRGFDEMWGYTGGGHDYFSSKPDGKGYQSPIECNYKTPQPITYITDDKGDECVDFIKRHKNEPFFLFASFNAPHTPMQATESDLELYKHINDKKRRTYCAMVHRLDINVGRIIQALNDEGLTENTLVVFLSDNGGPCWINGSVNAPFNGKKGTLMEGGIHVPFIMNWKGKLPEGIGYESTVLSLDLAATFFDLAGGEITDDIKFDGINLMPYLLGETTDLPHESFNWGFTESVAIREGNWKLIRLPDRLPMLFDLSKDVSEQNNVALENLEITESLLKKVGQWDVMLPYPVFRSDAIWKKLNLDLYDKEYQLVQPED